MLTKQKQLACRSGLHHWLNDEDRKRCCHPDYERVQGTSRTELEEVGAENIVLRGMWRGWRRKNGK